MGGFLYSEV